MGRERDLGSGMDIFTSLGIKSGLQAVNEGKRRSSAPCILFGFDRTINLISTAIPGTVLAFVITFGGAIYKSEGLELVNPRDRENGGLRFDRWTEVTTVKEYCWNHLGNVVDNGAHSMEYQHHYSLFPYLLLFITLSMAFLEATWRFSDLDKLVSVLDFVIDGLEESIRDVIQFLIEEDGGSRIALNESKVKVEVIPKKVNGEGDQLIDVEDLVAEKEEECLNERFQKHFAIRGFNGKFEKFNKIAQDFSKSRKFLNRFWFKRIMVIFFNLLSIGILSLLYYHPVFNLERFNCPLPKELHYINSKNETVISAVHYYNAYRFRTLMVEMLLSLQIILVLGAPIVWIRLTSVKAAGTRLLMNLPMIDQNLLAKDGYNDLNLILDLVIVNRERAKYIGLALDVLDTIQVNVENQNRNIGFLRTLRELANWHTSDDTNIEKIVNGIQANNNWNR